MSQLLFINAFYKFIKLLICTTSDKSVCRKMIMILSMYRIPSVFTDEINQNV